MKNFCLALMCLALSLAALAEADKKKDDLTDLYARLSAVSPKVVKAGYTILHIEFDRLGGAPAYSFKRSLQKGYKYKIVGVGARGIEDIEVKLLDGKSQVVAQDESQDGVGIVNLTPGHNGNFTIRLAGAKMASGSEARPYFFCLVASKPEKAREKTAP
jgi:hypothetical protein